MSSLLWCQLLCVNLHLFHSYNSQDFLLSVSFQLIAQSFCLAASETLFFHLVVVNYFLFVCLIVFFNWSDCFINVLISGSPPGYLKNHRVCSAHKNHQSHLLYTYVYAYFLGVGDMGRILIQSPGSFRFCRNAQASSL